MPLKIVQHINFELRKNEDVSFAALRFWGYIFFEQRTVRNKKVLNLNLEEYILKRKKEDGINE